MTKAADSDAEEMLRTWAGRLLLSPRDAVPCPVSDPEAVVRFLKRHGIELCISHLLCQHPPNRADSLPSPNTRHAIAIELARSHELARLMGVLQYRFAEPPLIIKGQALAHTLYPQPWLRPRGDVDILVDRPILSQTIREMQMLGYEKVLSTEGDLIMTQMSMYRYSSGVEHVWDIHWKISNRPAFSGVLPYHELQPGATKVRLHDTTFHTPCHVDSLLIACLHLIGHHGGEMRMVWLYDIHLLAAALTAPEQRQFLEKATGSAPVRAACHAALELTARYLPAAQTYELRRTLDPGAAARRPTTKTYLAQLAEDSRAVGHGKRLQFIRQHVFPSRDYMVRRFRVRHRWQLPLWYAIRIARALPKLFRLR